MLVSVCFCCCSVNPRLEESTMEQGDEGLLHYWWSSWLYLWAYVPINIPVLSPQLGGKEENDLIKQEQQCGSNFTHYPLPYFSSHALKLQNGKPVPCSASCCSPGRGGEYIHPRMAAGQDSSVTPWEILGSPLAPEKLLLPPCLQSAQATAA